MEAILYITEKIKFLDEVWSILFTFITVFEARGFKTSGTNLIKTAGMEWRGSSIC